MAVFAQLLSNYGVASKQTPCREASDAQTLSYVTCRKGMVQSSDEDPMSVHTSESPAVFSPSRLTNNTRLGVLHLSSLEPTT